MHPPTLSAYMANSFTNKFAKKLKEERLARNISQEKLAFSAGVSRNFISMIERGERTVTLTKLNDIARVLGVEPWQLLKF